MDTLGQALWWIAVVGTVVVIALVFIQLGQLRRQGETWGEAFSTSVTMWLPNTLWAALVMFVIGSAVMALAGQQRWDTVWSVSSGLLVAIPLSAVAQQTKGPNAPGRFVARLALIGVVPFVAGLVM